MTQRREDRNQFTQLRTLNRLSGPVQSHPPSPPPHYPDYHHCHQSNQFNGPPHFQCHQQQQNYPNRFHTAANINFSLVFS